MTSLHTGKSASARRISIAVWRLSGRLRENDKQVDIAVRIRFATSMGAEEDQAYRLKILHDTISQYAKQICRCCWEACLLVVCLFALHCFAVFSSISRVCEFQQFKKIAG